MILIADSGATKTSWALVEEDNLFIHNTAGFNPYYMDKSVIESILLNELPDKIRKAAVHSIYYYGSG